MILFKTADKLRNWLDDQQQKGTATGFVPTMGALHEGHISLVRASREQGLLTVCSIFVNPTQFNDASDFKKYPVTIEQDIRMLEASGCDILFLPSVDEIYPHGTKPTRHYDLGYLETVLEGAFRPGHFQGVCMVVHRLLEIVKPAQLFLGQKDYQQCMVISKLVELTGMQAHTLVQVSPTLREPGGLAMSSRNMRLNDAEKEKARTLFRVLQKIKTTLQPGDLNTIKKEAVHTLEQAGFRVDYVAIAGAGDLALVDHWDGEKKLVALVAAFLNDVRLIDNMLLN